MIHMIRFGLRELLNQWKLALAMALVAAIAFTLYLTVAGFQKEFQTQFGLLQQTYLTVQEIDSFGEIYGSRLTAQVGEQLKEMAVEMVVPEIHDIIGTSIEDALLLRGIDLVQYTRVENFRMVAGRALGPDEPPRRAMVGYRLAESKKLSPGGTISLRGRDFDVIGIFRTDTYDDNEAWISLRDAQALLGWGTDVSVYIIPAGGPIRAGDIINGTVTAAVRGEAGQSISDQYKPVVDDHGAAAQVMGLVTALTLANVLLRLALIRRHDLAVFRSLGFQRRSLSLYLGVQALVIALVGAGLAGLGVLALSSVMKLDVVGFNIQPIFDFATLIKSAGWLSVITLMGTIIPLWALNRLNLAELLRSE